MQKISLQSQQVGIIRDNLTGHDLSRSDQHRMNQFERRRVSSEEPNQGLSHLDSLNQISLLVNAKAPVPHWIPVRDRFDETEGGLRP